MRASDCQALLHGAQWKMICSQDVEKAVLMTEKHAILLAILTIKVVYYILYEEEIVYNGIANGECTMPKEKSVFGMGSVLLKWACSYLLVLLIPLATFVVGMRLATSTVRQEISRANAVMLENVREAIDSDLQTIESAFQFAFANLPTVSLNLAESKDASRNYVVYDLVKALDKYSRANGNVKFTLYFADTDFLVSTSTANDVQTLYYVQKMAGLQEDVEAWRARLAGSYANDYAFLSGMVIGEVENSMTFCHTVQRQPGRVNIFISLPDGLYRNLLQNEETRGLFIVDAAGNVVQRLNGPYDLQSVNLALAPDASLRVGQDRCVQSAIPSQYADWYYVTLTPEGDYWQSIQRVTTAMAVTCAISLAIGLVLAAQLVKRNYRPLGALTLQLGGRINRKQNEFQAIAEYCHNVSVENQNMHREIDAYAAQLRERALLNRLKGRQMLLSDKDVDAHYALGEAGESYVLVVFALARVSEEELSRYRDSLEYGEALFHAIGSSFAGRMQGYSYEQMEDGYMLLYLLRLTGGQVAKWREEGRALLTQVDAFIQKRISSKVTVAVSGVASGFGDIHILYNSVMDALEYRSIAGGQEQGVVFAEECAELVGGSMGFQNDETFREMERAVCEGDIKRCEELMGRLGCPEGDALQFAVFRLSMMNGVKLVMRAFFQRVQDAQLRYRFTQWMEACLEAQQKEELQESFLRLLRFACQNIGGPSAPPERDPLAERVRKLVQQRYDDPNLNISAIAEALGKNANYLSQAFSKSAGESLMDYIRGVRVARAMDLLASTNMTIEQISEKTGFGSVRTFRRAFVQVTGMQPNAYRQRHALGQEFVP